jgi:hypothetical protein
MSLTLAIYSIKRLRASHYNENIHSHLDHANLAHPPLKILSEHSEHYETPYQNQQNFFSFH